MTDYPNTIMIFFFGKANFEEKDRCRCCDLKQKTTSGGIQQGQAASGEANGQTFIVGTLLQTLYEKGLQSKNVVHLG